MGKKLTFDEVIAKKMQQKQDTVRFKEIDIPSMGISLLFEKPQEDDVFACIDMIGEGNNIKNVIEAYEKLIYNCCAELKDPKRHEQLDIKIPTDIVKALFDISERVSIGNQLVEMSGMQSIGDNIKK